MIFLSVFIVSFTCSLIHCWIPQGDNILFHIGEQGQRRWSFAFRLITSLTSHFCILVCLWLIFWSMLSIKDEDRKQYLLSSTTACAVGYIIIFTEVLTSDTFSFLNVFHGEETGEEYIHRVCEAHPLVHWHAVCYHYEMGQHGIYNFTMSNMNIHDKIKRKIVSLRDTGVLDYTNWQDVTRDMSEMLRKPLLRVKVSNPVQVRS